MDPFRRIFVPIVSGEVNLRNAGLNGMGWGHTNSSRPHCTPFDLLDVDPPSHIRCGFRGVSLEGGYSSSQTPLQDNRPILVGPRYDIST